MTRRAAWWGAALMVACGGFLAGPRNACASDGVKRVGVQAGLAGMAGNEGTFAGYGGGVDFAWGLSDAWSIALTATASSNQVTATKDGGRSLVLSQSIGVEYAIDIVQVVPYLGLFVGGYEIRGGGVTGTQYKVGGQIAIGIDWIYSRDLTLGIELRIHALPADFAKHPDDPVPFYTTAMLKAEYTWGWF